MAGYSNTPLVKKLGFKEGFRVYVKNAPEGYDSLVQPLPEGTTMVKRLTSELDLVHIFVTKRSELESSIDQLASNIKQNGSIWVSWPKKSSPYESEVTGDVIRDVILPKGLVDIKVCAINEIWSGLKVVIRKENRKKT